MRKISANLILPLSSPPLKNGIITIDDKGMILNLHDTDGNLREESGLEFYNGIIVPGFVLRWLRFDQASRPADPFSADSPESSLKKLNQELLLNGIKGVGLVLREKLLSDGGFKIMLDSPIFYHPVIELCPESGENEFRVFNRGIELVSHAWNEFNLSCSLTVCSPAMENPEFGKYLLEYASSHQNVSPPKKTSPETSLNILKNMQKSGPGKSLEEILPLFTLQAAAGIFEDDVLGSIETGKTPGLNLISGLDPKTLSPIEKPTLKVLV